MFEAGKPESLSKMIIEVLQLDETTLKSLGNEGRKNVIKKFNIEKMCFSTYLEYKKINKLKCQQLNYLTEKILVFQKKSLALRLLKKISKSLSKQAIRHER